MAQTKKKPVRKSASLTQRNEQAGGASRIRAELETLSRRPFVEELATLLAHPTDPKAMQRWANRSPDRRAQALAILGRLAGYTEKVQVSHSLTVRIQEMSDAELALEFVKLLPRLREMERELAENPPKALKAKPDG